MASHTGSNNLLSCAQLRIIPGKRGVGGSLLRHVQNILMRCFIYAHSTLNFPTGVKDRGLQFNDLFMFADPSGLFVS